MFVLVWQAIIILALGILLYKLNQRRRFYQLASKIPGPKPLPLIGNALQILPHVNRILHKVSDLLKDHGGIAAVWLGSDLNVFISDPDYLEVFFNSTKLMDHSYHYKFMEGALGRLGLFTSNGELWKRNRKLYMPIFSPAKLKTYVPIFHKHSLVLTQNFEKKIGQPEFDVFEVIMMCTLDIIAETAMSHNLSSQHKHIPAVDNIALIMALINKRFYTPYQYPNILYNILPDGRAHNKAAKSIHDYLDDAILERAEEHELDKKINNVDKYADFLRQMLDVNMDFQEIRDHVLNIAITGFDATAGALGFVLMMLGIHQDVQEKVYEEIKTVKEHVNNRELEEQDLEMLQYMDLVIKETLRLFPTGPIILRNVEEDVVFGKYTVPKGATVACAIITTHRDPTIFPNPSQFNTDNFQQENVDKRHPYAYVPFSSGPRSCIGMKYGVLSMKVMLMELIAKYRIFCDRTMADLIPKAELTLKIEGGFKIRIESR